MNTTQQTDEPDQFAEICRAMKPGLLISVNNDDSATNSPSDELRVVSSGSPVHLVRWDGQEYYQLYQENGDTFLAPMENDRRGRGVYVETIEIIGIDDAHEPI